LDQSDIAEGAAGGEASVAGAVVAQTLLAHGEVEGHLVVKVAIDAAAAEERRQSQPGGME
jgi:hypothetical protein